MIKFMRFVPDGPDIPEKLIRRWRSGHVVFLVGAGVSVPSKLPLFSGLALAVYKHLGDSLHGTLSTAKEYSLPSRRMKILASASLSPQRRVECDLFLDNQFDRLFSALETRMDQDAKGRTRSRNVRNAVKTVLNSGVTCSSSHKDILWLSIAPGVPVNSADGRMPRLATTNFDLLLEQAWKMCFGTVPHSHDARTAPRAGSPEFGGIIHLHGMIDPSPGKAGDFILSSRDFARAYMRSGPIANYIYDLVRKYTVVLIGYSAEDPPMRYLMDAIGEDATLFEDMTFPYAIADRTSNPGDADGAIEEARWRSKNIEPILFPRRPGRRPFEPLWETIGSWADWARDDLQWVIAQLEQRTTVPHDSASPYNRSFVQDLLSLLNSAELTTVIDHLNRRRVDFGWVEVVDAAIEKSAISST